MKHLILALLAFTVVGCATAPVQKMKSVWDLDSIRSNPEKMKKAQVDSDECVEFGFKTAAAKKTYHRETKDFFYTECMNVRGYKSILVPDVSDVAAKGP